MIPRVLFALLFFCLAVSDSSTPAHGAPLVELSTSQGKYVGQIVAFNERQLWLQEASGALRLLDKEELQSFQQKSGSFRLLSATDLRGVIRQELGNDLEVRGTGHYLVFGQKQSVEEFAPLFEEIYRSFMTYFNVRGIPLQEPSQPLVAVVLPNQRAFAQYAARDGVVAGRGLAGYYIRTTNRVSLFENEAQAALDPGGTPDVAAFLPQQSHTLRELFANDSGQGAFATIEGNLRDTIVHEVTHQMAFNTGIHNRLSENPKWFVEGLACVFEAPGIRRGDPSGKVSTRINPERLGWFRTYRQSRRPEKYLKAFISTDEPFNTATLDAYSESWGLTFFLIETRRREYGAYVRKVAARPPLQEYTAEERIEDFENAFGRDWSHLENAYLRYLEALR